MKKLFLKSFWLVVACGIGLGLYLFCLGPCVRWFPGVAEVIYSPLCDVADWPAFGDFLWKVMHRWMALWGVDVEGDVWPG